jgi:hypothetical protein
MMDISTFMPLIGGAIVGVPMLAIALYALHMAHREKGKSTTKIV